jgi:hypothetical protein
MLWRGPTSTIHVLRADGTYASYDDRWREGMPSETCEADPPAGLIQPIRGFGMVWCLQEGVPDALGWATESERALSVTHQRFAQGDLIRDGEGRVVVLWDNGTWQDLAP